MVVLCIEIMMLLVLAIHVKVFEAIPEYQDVDHFQVMCWFEK